MFSKFSKNYFSFLFQLGIKNAETALNNDPSHVNNLTQSDQTRPLENNSKNSNNNNSTKLQNHFHDSPSESTLNFAQTSSESTFDKLLSASDFPLTANNNMSTPELNNKDSIYRFNGCSNIEILVLFAIALISNLLFEFQQADYIYKVYLVKILIHLVLFDFNYLI